MFRGRAQPAHETRLALQDRVPLLAQPFCVAREIEYTCSSGGMQEDAMKATLSEEPARWLVGFDFFGDPFRNHAGWS